MKIDEELLKQEKFYPYDFSKDNLTLLLDGQTLKNLEIFENSVDGGDEGTLFKILNHCTTPFGKRLLKKWICHPLQSVPQIEDRLNAIDDLNSITSEQGFFFLSFFLSFSQSRSLIYMNENFFL